MMFKRNNCTAFVRYTCASMLFLFSQSSVAAIIPIDLNDFFADPTVSVSVDGSTATIAEDSLFSPVLLANDPGLGDPVVIVAGVATSLVFDYIFNEPMVVNGPVEDDVFNAFLLDGTSGLSFGAVFEFSTSMASQGSIVFDLTSLVGELIGLQFELGANIGDASLLSTVSISNLRLQTQDIMSVPEPSVLFLFGIGLLISTCFTGRRNSRAIK